MKNLLLLLALFIGANSIAQGQGDITIYANTGDKFFVILNGVRQNQQAETNVKVTGLTDNFYSCKIISGNNNFEIDKNVIVKHDTLVTYRIIEKKGKYKLRFYSETALGTSTSVQDQTVVQYSQTDPPVVDNGSTTTVSSGNSGMNESTTTTTTTTTSTSTTNDIENGIGSESVNMNINISENGMSADVNVSGTGMEGSGMNTTTNTSTSMTVNGTTTEETTTSTSSGGNGTTTYYEETTTTTTTSSSNNNGNLYQDNEMSATLTTNCNTTDEDVKNLKKQIQGEAFSDDQQRVADMAAKNKCMSVAQIKEVASAFTFSENQLSFLKAAYENCTEQGNYYQLMESLTFSADKEELEKFINSK